MCLTCKSTGGAALVTPDCFDDGEEAGGGCRDARKSVSNVALTGGGGGECDGLLAELISAKKSNSGCAGPLWTDSLCTNFGGSSRSQSKESGASAIGGDAACLPSRSPGGGDGRGLAFAHGGFNGGGGGGHGGGGGSGGGGGGTRGEGIGGGGGCLRVVHGSKPPSQVKPGSCGGTHWAPAGW